MKRIEGEREEVPSPPFERVPFMGPTRHHLVGTRL